jgi:thermitase
VKRTGICTILGLIAATALLAVPSTAGASDHLIVGFKNDATSTERLDALDDAGVDGIDTARQLSSREIGDLDAAIVTVPEGEGNEVSDDLENDPDVRWVETDHKAHLLALPNDPLFNEQWGMLKIGAATAWDSTDGTGALIAVVDTGVAYDHQDLKGKIVLGKDFVDNDMDPMDVNGHGTHVSGIAAGIANNDFGVAGVAPGAQILAVRVLDGDGAGYYSWIAKGIIYAADHGAKVINLSLGGEDASTALEEAVNYANARGAVVTCATGNESAKALGYPARYTGCFAVGATTSSDGRASFSNYGPNIDIAAPGEDILSSVMDGGHEEWSGTSMATPFVSGLAGLLAARGLTRRQIESTIKNTAVDLGPAGYDQFFGYGRIDAAAALATTVAPDPNVPADTTAPTVGDQAHGNLGFRLGARYARTVVKTVNKWVTTKTRWKRVSRANLPNGLTWSETEKGKGWTKVHQYRVRHSVLQQRVVTRKKKKVKTRHRIVYRNIQVHATDNVGVDRVGAAMNGHWIGTDYSASGGWTIKWTCKVGTYRVVIRAFDAKDNTGTSVGKVKVKVC